MTQIVTHRMRVPFRKREVKPKHPFDVKARDHGDPRTNGGGETEAHERVLMNNKLYDDAVPEKWLHPTRFIVVRVEDDAASR